MDTMSLRHSAVRIEISKFQQRSAEIRFRTIHRAVPQVLDCSNIQAPCAADS